MMVTQMDTSILLFALLISLVTAVLFSSAPALKAARLSLNDILQGSRDPSGGRTARALHHGLVIAQIASAFVLAIGAGLLGRSLDQLLRVDGGYDPHHLLTMTTFIYDGTSEKELHHYQRIVERVRVIPGVLDAAMVSTLPLSSPQQNSVYLEGRSLPNEAEAPVIDSYFASPEYFRVMKIPLRRGRFFTSQDGLKAPAVAIVSESCARSLFPNEDPIGKRIGFGDRIQWQDIAIPWCRRRGNVFHSSGGDTYGNFLAEGGGGVRIFVAPHVAIDIGYTLDYIRVSGVGFKDSSYSEVTVAFAHVFGRGR